MTDSPDLGILIADRSLIVRSWDRWLETVTGVTSEVASGRPLAEVAPGFEARGFLARFNETLTSGAVHVLSPAFHRYLVPCAPRVPSPFFTQMQQRVHVGPLLDGTRIEGLIITIADVTPQLDDERRLAARLESKDPEERRAAAATIAKAAGPAAMKPFAPALDAEDWKIRRAAVRTLAKTADRELLHSLVETLRRDHRSFNTLSSALKVLAMSNVPMTAPLVELLGDADADLRIQAALALGEQQDPEAVEALVQTLQDPDANVRFHAIEALGRLRATDAVDALAAIVESGDVYLAFAAIDALALINDRRVAQRLAPLLGHADLRDAVAAALGVLGDEEAVTPLIETLNTHAEATAAVAAALAAIDQRERRELGEVGHIAGAMRAGLTPQGERHVLEALDDASPDALVALTRLVGWVRGDGADAALVRLLAHAHVRDLAIDALVARGEGVIDALRDSAASEDAAVALAAVATLGRIGSRRGTPLLVPLLDESPDLAIAAAGALSRIGDPDAFEALIAQAGHPHAAVRQAVVGALNAIGHADMPARIGALIDDPDPYIRESAVRIAGYFGYESAVDTLIARTADPEEAVRAAAIEHLPFVDDARVFDTVQRGLGDRAPRVRAAAARALARIEGHGAHEALLWALRDGDLWVRYYAARALGERGDAAAVAPLTACAAADTAPHVRIAALDALGFIGNADAWPALSACAEDPDEDVTAAALRALGALRTSEGLSLLQRATRAESIKIRLSAVAGLGADGSPAAVSALAWLAGTDTIPAVFEAAVAALADIASSTSAAASSAVDALVELQAIARRAETASGALCRLGAARVDDVARGLAHPQADVRRRTVDTLARMRTSAATRFVAQALDDEVAAVRETAVLAVTRLGARGFAQRVQALARHDESKAVRRAAADAAVRLRGD